MGDVYGFRTMARNIAARVSGSVGLDEYKAMESWRRQIHRYLKAQTLPTDRIRILLAEELGCDPAALGVVTDDDSEPRSMADDLFARIEKLERARDAELRELRKMARQMVKGATA